MTATQVTMNIPPGQAPGKYRVLEGEYTDDITITNADATHIRGTVIFKEGAYLRIESGAVLYGELETRGKLVIEENAYCIGIGTMETPIRFTSNQVKSPHVGDWEGIVLNGLTRFENVIIEYARIGVTVNNKSVRIYNGLMRRNQIKCEGIKETVWKR